MNIVRRRNKKDRVEIERLLTETRTCKFVDERSISSSILQASALDPRVSLLFLLLPRAGSPELLGLLDVKMLQHCKSLVGEKRFFLPLNGGQRRLSRMGLCGFPKNPAKSG